MAKLIAVLNVVAWSGFWAFGYLALTTHTDASRQMTITIILAALGAGMGVWAYLWLIRHSENTGYSRRPNRATPEHHRANVHESGETA